MMVLVTGGSKCGKSRIAEDIVTKNDLKKYYIATMEPFSEEAQIAIERHRKMRAGKGFITIEKYTDIGNTSEIEDSAVLLECMGNLVANEMYSEGGSVDRIIPGIESLKERAKVLVIVTNQVGDDGIIYEASTMEYIDNLGKVNAKLAEMADEVIEAVYGIPVKLK